MTQTERIEILKEVEVVASTMKDISEEFLKVPTTPSNIDSHLELAHLLTKLMQATKLADTIINMK